MWRPFHSTVGRAARSLQSIVDIWRVHDMRAQEDKHDPYAASTVPAIFSTVPKQSINKLILIDSFVYHVATTSIARPQVDLKLVPR